MTYEEYSELKFLAEATRNAGLIEQLRVASCEQGGDVEDCRCWGCERYGLDSYYDFQLHQDRYPPESVSLRTDGVCYCWVCEMSRNEYRGEND